jgi:chromosome segregation ATPase
MDTTPILPDHPTTVESLQQQLAQFDTLTDKLFMRIEGLELQVANLRKSAVKSKADEPVSHATATATAAAAGEEALRKLEERLNTGEAKLLQLEEELQTKRNLDDVRDHGDHLVQQGASGAKGSPGRKGDKGSPGPPGDSVGQTFEKGGFLFGCVSR